MGGVHAELEQIALERGTGRLGNPDSVSCHILRRPGSGRVGGTEKRASAFS